MKWYALKDALKNTSVRECHMIKLIEHKLQKPLKYKNGWQIAFIIVIFFVKFNCK